MAKLFNRINQWEKDRLIAHWILRQILDDTIRLASPDFLLSDTGQIQLERSGSIFNYEYSELRISYLINIGDYTKPEIYSAIHLLEANKHIENTGRAEGAGLDETTFKATPEGVLAFKSNRYLDEVEERKANWPRRNWFLYDLLKITMGVIIGLMLGYYFRKATEPKNNQLPSQNKSYQPLPKSPDAGGKKNSAYSHKIQPFFITLTKPG